MIEMVLKNSILLYHTSQSERMNEVNSKQELNATVNNDSDDIRTHSRSSLMMCA